MAAIFACALLASATACKKDDGSGAVFKYNISTNPQSLDPQTAADRCSDLLIGNIYLGLFALNADGSLGEGVAHDYTVSENGLKYKFYLNENIYWADGAGYESECTADDFVYGFQRLFKPETRAARASEYFCIANSEAINSGVLTDYSQLGVKSNGKYELEITLTTANPRFLEMLADTPAMPCSEEYFIQSKGKYGLSAETTPSNGAFYVKSWAYDPYTVTDNNNMILRRNAKNADFLNTMPSGLNFFIVKESQFVSDYNNSVTSCIAVTDEQAASVSSAGTVKEYRNITSGLIFNRKSALLRNTAFRQALAALVDRRQYAPVLANYGTAKAIVPEDVSLLDMKFREYAGMNICTKYSVDAAQTLYGTVESRLDKTLLVGARIIVPDEVSADVASYINQEWQRELGFYCTIEQLAENEYNSRLESGDFDIAVIDLTGEYNSPEAYLSAFLRGSTANYGKYSSSDFESLMKSASTAADMQASAELYKQAEQLLIDDAAFVPLYYKNEYFFTAKDCEDILYNPFTKTISFKDAKAF